MSEQTANLCTTDACESLRARLAKYEDAEGRPIGQLSAFYSGVKAASDHVKEIVAEYDQRHGSTDPDTGTREYPGNGEEWVGQMLELIEDFTGIVAPAALKAQPSGVVDSQRLLDWNRSQPEPRPIVVGREYQVAEACARLNSSPVSAGDDAQYPPCDYCAEPLSYHPWHGSGLINGVESRHIHACDKCRHLLPAVSAGVVDERE